MYFRLKLKAQESMRNKGAVALVGLSLMASSAVNAGISPYITGEVGFAKSNYTGTIGARVGGGLRFNDHAELELAYNHFGDTGPFGSDISSFSYGLNLGGKVSENTRLFVAVGGERLDASGSASIGPYSYRVSGSDSGTYYGIGAVFNDSKSVQTRLRVTSHSSGDILNLNVGISYMF